MPPVLDPASLYKDEARRDATRIRTYNVILNQIYNKVKATARIVGGDKAIWYVVPELVQGAPRFDMGDAILYIVWNLRNVGYTVDFTYPNGLYVSWRSHDERYHMSESPWSKVLASARESALTSVASEPTVISYARAAPALSTPQDIIKRKTVLKKTVEFKPAAETIPRTSNPSIMGAMYSSAAPPAAPVSRLPGQLSERHVSFV